MAKLGYGEQLELRHGIFRVRLQLTDADDIKYVGVKTLYASTGTGNLQEARDKRADLLKALAQKTGLSVKAKQTHYPRS